VEEWVRNELNVMGTIREETIQVNSTRPHIISSNREEAEKKDHKIKKN
jgi:hypothetical protein